jgi:protein-tyrosine-phosphatase
MLDATAALVRALSYTGVGMVEFKLAADGAWSLVEINPRFWGSLPLAVAAGADFPYFLYQMLVEGRRDFPPGYRTGVYARNWIADLHWLRSNLRADRSDPTLLTRPASRVAGELLNVALLRERSDTLTLDDPMPALAELSQFARQASRRIRRGLNRRLSRIAGVRAMRGRRARDRAAGAGSILFVCKGNICRSPFAAAYAAPQLPHVRVVSAGYLGPVGRFSPAAARTAARAFGVDLVAHRSVLLDARAMDDASVIFCFDEENLARVGAEYPQHRPKVHLLSSILPSGPLEIDDPYGLGADVFDATYRRIAAAVDALVRVARPGAAARKALDDRDVAGMSRNSSNA